MMNVLFQLLIESAYACPGCAGSMDNPKEWTYFLVLTGFVALIYVPFYFIYRTIKKHKDLNQIEPTE